MPQVKENFAELEPGQAIQSAQTVERLGVLYGLLPAGLIFIAALLAQGCRLTAGEIKLIQADLARRGEALHETA